MREYHVNIHSKLEDFIKQEYRCYGSNLSVRKKEEDQPLIIVGQDESTFNQFVFSKISWKDEKGHQQLVPKGGGNMLMVLGYQGDPFGLGLQEKFTDEIKLEMNNNRVDQRYKSEREAELLHHSPLKKNHPIKSDATLVFFYTGVNGEGYWNCTYAKIQFEDVVDALYVVYPDHDFLFLFDHSSGHAKKREDGLNVK